MTSIPTPNCSNSQIAKAGKKLRSYKPGSSQYEEAKQIVNEWRTCHAYPLSIINIGLRAKTNKHPESIVAQRLKRMPTIIDKLTRQPNMDLSRMQDIGGVRAILGSVTKVRDVESKYLKQNYDIEDHKDYISMPKPDGYRGIHIIMRYKSTRAKGIASKYNGMKIEIQLRTELQHLWATAVETVGFVNDQNIKAGKGNKKWTDFFRLASAAFAKIEEMPTGEEFNHLTALEVYQKLALFVAKTKILDELSGITIATNKLKQRKHSADTLHLIQLDVAKHEFNIKSYAKKDIDAATKQYAIAEELAEKNPSFQAVLVSTANMKQLVRAYPNYFLDISLFVERIDILIQETKK